MTLEQQQRPTQRTVAQTITHYAPLIAEALPKHLDADRFTVCADVSGKWPTGTASDPVQRELTLCVGARVMTVANDPDGAYVNGSTGTLLEWTPNPGVALVRLDNGPEVEVRWHRWSQVERVWDDRRDRMVNRSVGEFVQLPLKLAYASTIHIDYTYDNMRMVKSDNGWIGL